MKDLTSHLTEKQFVSPDLIETKQTIKKRNAKLISKQTKASGTKAILKTPYVTSAVLEKQSVALMCKRLKSEPHL